LRLRQTTTDGVDRVAHLTGTTVAGRSLCVVAWAERQAASIITLEDYRRAERMMVWKRQVGTLGRMSGWLVSVVGALRQRNCSALRLRELFFVVFVAALAVGDVASVDPKVGERSVDLVAYGLVTAGSVSLYWSRRAPVIVLGFVGAILVTFWMRDYGSFVAILGVSPLYAVAAHERDRRLAWIALVVTTGVMLGAASESILDTPDGFDYLNAAAMIIYMAAAVAAGVAVRVYMDTQRRADEAEADRAVATARAVASERVRIAREMHDVVAHGMSVIAVQAAAAQEIAHKDPDKTVEVLSNIETAGREALTEMRRMLGVLRDSDDEDSALAPQPRLSDVSGAVAQSVEAGLPTHLVIDGQTRDLPPGVELAGFRIVQESLTNVRKHAGSAASATVRLEYDADSITIDVTDDGRGDLSGSASAELAEGNGLIGMRERVEIYGGEFQAGPRRGGGYAVHAVLPVADVRPGVTSAAHLVEPSS